MNAIPYLHGILAGLPTSVPAGEDPSAWLDATRKHVLATWRLLGEEETRFAHAFLGHLVRGDLTQVIGKQLQLNSSGSWSTPLRMSNFAPTVCGTSTFRDIVSYIVDQRNVCLQCIP